MQETGKIILTGLGGGGIGVGECKCGGDGVVEFLQVGSGETVAAVAGLARVIWNEHFVPLIGQAQVDYMLAQLQSAVAIAQQVEDGTEYWLMQVDGADTGYVALTPDAATGSAMLSKFYIRAQARGKGLGRSMMAFVESRCRELELHELWLTVNRGNAGPIAIYAHLGFAISGTQVKDIGQGFIMDDYRMSKKLC
jgi:GNAT superfamily N-acetyltransferase